MAARASGTAASGFAAIRADWLARAAGIGEPIRVRLGRSASLSAAFETLDDSGRLVLRLPTAASRPIAAGDVVAPAIRHVPASQAT